MDDVRLVGLLQNKKKYLHEPKQITERRYALLILLG